VSALRAGMSVDVEIDTGHQTTLSAVLARARPWTAARHGLSCRPSP